MIELRFLNSFVSSKAIQFVYVVYVILLIYIHKLVLFKKRRLTREILLLKNHYSFMIFDTSWSFSSDVQVVRL